MKLYKNYVDGVWSDGGGVVENTNPSDLSDVIGNYAVASADQTREAIAAARAAFPKWSQSGLQLRADVLDGIGNEILARKEDLGTLLSREEGKTRAEGIFEAVRAAYVFKFFAGEALRPGGERLPSIRPGMEVEVSREAVGVIGLITPWNFPLLIPAWKIGASLAFGNCVVFKPASLVPGSAWALTEIISRTELPAGVFNLVIGSGHNVGEVISQSPAINAISFTGSVETGRTIAAAAISNQTKLQFEMGGKNPLIILDDSNLDVAVDCAAQGAFYQTGQRCTASSRLIVTENIHDRFVEELVRRLRSLRVGHALEEGTDIGPVVDRAQLDTDMAYIEIGRKEGAQIAYGGERINRETDGYYLGLTLFTETTNDMRVNQEEIFGPVASVIRVRDYDEALATANDTSFGLSSGICTTSLKYATHFKRHTQSGVATVNLPTAGVDYHVPFGGRKASSYGPREQGSYAREFYTTVKTSYIYPGI